MKSVDVAHLLDTLDFPAAILDRGLEIVYLNKSLKTTFPNGVDFQSLITPSAGSDLLNKGDAEALLEVIDEKHKTYKWHFHKNGSSYIYASCTVVDFEEDDELLRLIKELNDQKYALDESSIVAITNAKGIITYVNEKFCEISQYTAEELLGKTHSIINSRFHDPSFFKEMWSTIAEGHIWRGEVKNKAKDGSFYWVHTTIVPFCDENGKPYQYVAIRTDITEKKEAIEMLQNERVRTMHAEKMASLGEMAAGIAHELGNPVSSINSWLQILQSAVATGDLSSVELDKTLPMVIQRADQMQKIITGMLTFARDGSKDPMEPINISHSIQNVLEYTSYKLRKSGVEVRNQVANTQYTCQARPSELAQVFVNLISNSCDAIKGSDSPWIEISAEKIEGYIDIYFKDSGSGIPKEIAEKIFAPFFTTKPTGQGTGLGLSISRSIMLSHNGDLMTQPEAEHTTLIVRLPIEEQSP